MIWMPLIIGSPVLIVHVVQMPPEMAILAVPKNRNGLYMPNFVTIDRSVLELYLQHTWKPTDSSSTNSSNDVSSNQWQNPHTTLERCRILDDLKPHWHIIHHNINRAESHKHRHSSTINIALFHHSRRNTCVISLFPLPSNKSCHQQNCED
jgi:hypothetical protein